MIFNHDGLSPNAPGGNTPEEALYRAEGPGSRGIGRDIKKPLSAEESLWLSAHLPADYRPDRTSSLASRPRIGLTLTGVRPGSENTLTSIRNSYPGFEPDTRHRLFHRQLSSVITRLVRAEAEGELHGVVRLGEQARHLLRTAVGNLTSYSRGEDMVELNHYSPGEVVPAERRHRERIASDWMVRTVLREGSGSDLLFNIFIEELEDASGEERRPGSRHLPLGVPVSNHLTFEVFSVLFRAPERREQVTKILDLIVGHAGAGGRLLQEMTAYARTRGVSAEN